MAARPQQILSRGQLPERFWQFKQAPEALYLTGSLAREPYVAIIGTRGPSKPGLEFAHDLAAALCRAGVSVVSGGAVGIDRAAHQGALSAGGPTLVVAPAGWERAYPEENQALFQRIVAEGGGYLSLLHPRQPTQRGLFLRRNGCMVALSQAVVLVEAPYRSGARNAAKHARDLGRPLMVVPSSPWVKSGRGSNVELKSGALLVQSSADVLANLKNLGILSKACAPGSSLQLPFEERSSAEERLLRAVHAGAHDVDALSQSTGLSLPEVQAALFALRLTGTLSVDPTGQISLSAP